MSSLDYFFIIGFPINENNSFLIEELKFSDSQKNIEIGVEEVFKEEKVIYKLYKYNIQYPKNTEIIKLDLLISYYEYKYEKKNNPIKINITKNDTAIFNYEHFEFIVSAQPFYVPKIIYITEPPKFEKLTNKKLFELYINYFKDKQYLEQLLNQSFNYLFSLSETNDNDRDCFSDLDEEFFNKYSLYTKNSFKKLIEQLLERMLSEYNDEHFNDFITDLKYYLSVFNDRRLPEFENYFFIKIFSLNDLKLFCDKTDIIKYLFDYIQFHDEWFAKLFNQINWENTEFKNLNLESHNYKETIFKLIKYPLFVLNKNNNNLENEKQLRNIFNFICLFIIENIDQEYTCLIPSNQIEYYKILSKEKNINKNIFSIFMEINNYDDLNKWFNENLKKDIVKTIKIIIRNKEYVYVIMAREKNKKLIVKKELLENINNINEIIYYIEILNKFQTQINYRFIKFEGNFDKKEDNGEVIIKFSGKQEIYNNEYTKVCSKCMFFINKEISESHLLIKCNKNKLICFNCFNLIPLNEYIYHNYESKKCYRIEEFYNLEIEIMLKDFNIENFKFLDYFFKKDNYYNTSSFHKYINSIFNDNYFNKPQYINFLHFFCNILFRNNNIKLIDDFLDEMNNIIKNRIFFIKKEWFATVKFYIEKLSKKEMTRQYNKFIEVIISLIIKEEFVKQRNDWFEIIIYLEKTLRKDKNYDSFGNNLITIISETFIQNMNNYIEIITYLMNSFGNNQKTDLFKKFSLKIIPNIIGEYFSKIYSNLSTKEYLENFDKSFIKYNCPDLKIKFFSYAIMNNYKQIKINKYLLLYFFELAQYDLDLTNYLLNPTENLSFDNIDFTLFEEFIFKRLKNPPFEFSDENKIISNLETISLLLLNITRIDKIQDFIYFCPEFKVEYYRNHLNYFSKIQTLVIPITYSFQLNNWIIKNNKDKGSINTLRILLRNKEYIYILCARDFTLITFNEDNKDFIEKNKDEFYFLVKCFKNYQQIINYTFIEFCENLTNIHLKENKIMKQACLTRCEYCGFKVIEDYYDNHINSKCEYSNNIICYFCFKNFEIRDFIKHREDICIFSTLNDINENNNIITNSLNSLQNKVNDLNKKIATFQKENNST